MRLWKDPNTRDCIRNRAGARDDVAEEHRNGTWKKTLERSVHGYEGLATEEEVVKIDAAEVGMANDFSPGVQEADTEELRQAGPEELPDEFLLPPEQQRGAEEEAGRRKLREEKKTRPPEDARWPA